MATQKKPTKPKPTKPTAPTKPKKAPAPEIEIDGVRVTNPDRALWGTSPLVTKGDLARYVAVVAPQMLRDLVGRPLSAVRHPRGALAPGFYQKHHTGGLPAAVHFVADEGFGKVERWLVVDDAAGLVALVQMGAAFRTASTSRTASSSTSTPTPLSASTPSSPPPTTSLPLLSTLALSRL